MLYITLILVVAVLVSALVIMWLKLADLKETVEDQNRYFEDRTNHLEYKIDAGDFRTIEFMIEVEQDFKDLRDLYASYRSVWPHRPRRG